AGAADASHGNRGDLRVAAGGGRTGRGDRDPLAAAYRTGAFAPSTSGWRRSANPSAAVVRRSRVRRGSAVNASRPSWRAPVAADSFRRHGQAPPARPCIIRTDLVA